MKRANSPTLAVASLFASSLAGSLLWYSDPDRWNLVLWTWLTAIGSFLWLARESDREAENEGDAGAPSWTRGEVLLLCFLLLIALGFRVFDLSELPGRLHNDEMSCGIEARKFLSDPKPPLFQTGWYSCPNLGFFLTALPMFVLGPTLEALRSSGVLLGLVSLLGAYLLIRELAGVPAAMILLALNVSHPWAVHLGRTGFIYVQAAAAGVFSLYFFSRALRRRSRFDAAAAGVVLGAGFQTYFSIRLMPFVLLVLAAAYLARRGKAARAHAVEALVMTAIGALVAILPLLVNYSHYPSLFNARSEDVFVFSAKNREHINASSGQVNPAGSLALVASQFERAGRFFYPGKDTSVQFAFESPFIPAPLWLPYLAGIVLIIWRLRERAGSGLFHAGLATIVASILMTFVAGAVLTIDPPFSPRLSLMQPVFLFPAAFGLAWLWGCGRLHRIVRFSAVSLVVDVVVWAGVVNARDYFVGHRIVAVGGQRDQIGRLVEKYPFVQGVLNLFPEPEDFEYQSYTFLAPGRNLVNGAGREALRQIVSRERPAWIWLVAAPLGTEFNADGSMAVIASGQYIPLSDDPERFSFAYWIVGPRADR